MPDALPQSSPLPLGPVVAPPRGYTAMLARSASYARRWSALIVLTPEAWAVIRQERETLEWAFEPDPAARDEWNPAANGVGDCEDWALACRRRLVMAGFPRDALLMAVCKTPASEDHAALVIATDRGDYVADVRRMETLPWAETGYQWIAVEGARGEWRAVVKTMSLAELAV